MTFQMKQSPPLVSNHRKEERPSGNIGSSIVWHFQRLSKVTFHSNRTGIEVGQAPACRLWKPMIAAAGGSLPYRDWSPGSSYFSNFCEGNGIWSPLEGNLAATKCDGLGLKSVKARGFRLLLLRDCSGVCLCGELSRGLLTWFPNFSRHQHSANNRVMEHTPPNQSSYRHG